MANGVAWWQKAGIGALGGLGLAILKLIDARFFLVNVSSTEVVAAYLTYFCYMLLGSLVAVFLADHDLPAPKLRRSSFVLGLLAPSVLLAIVTQPIRPGQPPTEGIKDVPKISSWLMPSAYAQEPAGSGAAPGPTEQPRFVKILVITKGEVQPSFTSAILSALGRKDIVVPHAYVVGTTTDKQQALEAAKKLNWVLSSAEGDVKLTPWVIKPEGAHSYYVTIGNLATPEKVLDVKLAARSAAIKTLMATPSPDDKQAATLLLQGKVVQARSFFDAGTF